VEPPPAPPVVPPTIPLTIGLRRGNRQLAVEAGGQRFDCQTPCTLDVPPGEVRIGPPAGRWRRELTVSVDGPSEAVLSRDRSGLGTAGLALAAGGGALTALGIIVAVAASPGISSNPGFASDGSEGFETGDAVGLAITIPGALAFVTGLVLLAVAPETYSARVGPAAPPPPTPPAEASAPRRRPRLRAVSLAPVQGGAAASAALTF
jgi:hypothetical protein